MAEATLDKYLDPAVTAIGAREEDDVIKLMRKLPSGIDPKKLHDALLKMGIGKLYRFMNSFSKEYISVLQEAMKSLGRDTFYSKMMMNSVIYALDKDFDKDENYTAFTELGEFLQYLDKLQWPVENPDQFAKSDPYITPAVATAAEHVLLAIQYNSRDIRVYNSFVYAAGKANLPKMEEIVHFQLGNVPRLNVTDEMIRLTLALKPNIALPNTARGYQIVQDKLKAIRNESTAYRFASAIGFDPGPDAKWNIKIEVDSAPESNGNGFVSIQVSNMWNDCIQLVVKGPKGQEKGNERHGVLKGKGLDFHPIDLFNLRTSMDEIGALYGIDLLHWKKATIKVTGLEKTAAKEVKKWLGI